MTEHADMTAPAQGDGLQPAGAEPQAAGWVPPGPAAQESAASAAAQHPEVMVGAAFAGGLLAALILKRLAG